MWIDINISNIFVSFILLSDFIKLRSVHLAIENLLHKFQEKNLNLNRDSNSDLQISSLALWSGSYSNSPSNSPLEMSATSTRLYVPWHYTRDLEVRVRVPVQVQIFLLKFNNGYVQRHKLWGLFPLIIWLDIAFI